MPSHGGVAEDHVAAQVVGAFAAVLAAPAGDPGLHGDAVARLEVGDPRAHFDDDAGGFVAQDHRAREDVGADAAALPAGNHLDSCA